MNPAFQATQVSNRVYWVGAIDWAIRDFHGYSTGRGTTYNAYLVLADKITLIDTVKAPFREEMLSRIASVVEPEKIDYIVSNHSEMDHSGSLPEVIRAVRPERVFASTIGAKTLNEHFSAGVDVGTVKDGETLSLGNMNLKCFETRMLHWPDSMISYLAEEEVLFSQDGFGMHLASGERFADELDKGVLEEEAAKYFANILMPYAPLVTKLLDRLGVLGVPVKVLAPDHGPIWRRDIERVLGYYGTWAKQAPARKAVVVYDTMWQSTALMARTIGEGLTAGNVHARLLPLGSSHRSDVVTELLDAGALLVGSPTMNNHMFPTVADCLTYLKGLKPANLIGAAFGSYGWSGEAIGHILDELAGMKIRIVGEGLKVKYVPDAGALDRCRSLGMQVAEELGKVCT